MACCSPKQVIWLLQLSVVLLLSSFTLLAYSHEDSFTVSYAQAPHYFPGHPPVGAPAPNHHHHPNHPLSPPPAKSPTQPPVMPPSPHHHHHHHPKHPISTPPPTPPTPPPHKPPIPPTEKPPSPPTTKPPTPAPVKPPVVPIRKLVAVQGVVYCKSCKYTGINTLTAATPLANATVRLMCANTKYHLVQDAKTDKNGYFFIMAQKVTTAGSHKCKVFLLSSPLTTCNVATDLHAGHKGAILMPPSPPPKSPSPPAQSKFVIFTVGPFAFEPPKKC